MQIIQFCLCLVHTGQLPFLTDCDYPKIFVYWVGLYALIFLVMFANFYRRSYNEKSSKKEDSNGNVSKNGSFRLQTGCISDAMKQD